jgi:hypothetical protein
LFVGRSLPEETDRASEKLFPRAFLALPEPFNAQFCAALSEQIFSETLSLGAISEMMRSRFCRIFDLSREIAAPLTP